MAILVYAKLMRFTTALNYLNVCVHNNASSFFSDKQKKYVVKFRE